MQIDLNKLNVSDIIIDESLTIDSELYKNTSINCREGVRHRAVLFIGRGGTFVEQGSLVEVVAGQYCAGQYCLGQVSLYLIYVIIKI